MIKVATPSLQSIVKVVTSGNADLPFVKRVVNSESRLTSTSNSGNCFKGGGDGMTDKSLHI